MKIPIMQNSNKKISDLQQCDKQFVALTFKKSKGIVLEKVDNNETSLLRWGFHNIKNEF